VKFAGLIRLTEIELLKQKLAALKPQKQGLMQKLLTGQVRVKPSPPALSLRERGAKKECSSHSPWKRGWGRGKEDNIDAVE